MGKVKIEKSIGKAENQNDMYFYQIELVCC